MESLPPGMISAADAPLLAAYCEAWSTHKAAVEALASRRVPRRDCLILRGKAAPAVKVMAEAARTMATLATRLGLSPADRSGLKLGDRSKGSGRWGGLVA
jgi:P27 family predicted phage terminase small subunit